MALQYLVFLLTVFSPGVQLATMKRMTMERTHTSDLETSASGYVYTHSSGQPTSYVHFTSNAAAAPLQDYQQYQQVPVVQYYVVNPEIVTQESEKNFMEEEEIENDHEGIVEDPSEADDNKEEYKADDDKTFENGGGEEYEKAEHSAHGEKGDNGYLNKHEYSNGEKGQYAEKEDQGHYKEKGGKNAGHYDNAGHYQNHYEAAKGVKGEKHGEKSSHKKGQKTTGFHNVYHKDEYKKDHTFYDEADKSGFYKKHGDYEAHKAKEVGGFKKGENHKSGYHDNSYGKKGSHDKGNYNKADQGYKGQKGHEEHHSSFEDYAKEAGQKNGKEYGYEEGKY